MLIENTIQFYPMTEIPAPDESDPSFSKTVMIYSDALSHVEFGYFDFEEQQWSHFSKTQFLIKCWCYIPNPKDFIKDKHWQPIATKGYKKNYF